MNLGMFPIAPMLFAFLIPMIYSLKWKKENIRKISIVTICSVFIVLFYPIAFYLGEILDSILSYFIGKILLFTIMPLITIQYLEKWPIKTALNEIGIKKDKIGLSIFLGLGVLILTVSVILIIWWSKLSPNSAYWNTILFVEAFNEEFFFRGVLLLYLWKITDIKIAYITSVLAFIFAHPQHFNSLWLLSTSLQAILLGIVTFKTKNIIGPWLSHGLNRIIPSIITYLI